MPKTIYITPAVVVERLRRKAKRLKKETGVTHQHALDLAAQQTKHFQSWHHVIQAAKLTEPSEQAFRHGFVFAMDFKDADLDQENAPFIVPDNQVAYFVIRDFKKSVKQFSEEDGYFLEELSDFVYFHCKGPAPATLKAALKRISKGFFFPPKLVWLRGEMHDPLAESGDVIHGENYVVWGGSGGHE